MIAELSDLPVHLPTKALEGIFINEQAHVLAELYPALLESARIYVKRYDMPPDYAEDLVQEAATAWLMAEPTIRSRSKASIFAWCCTVMNRTVQKAFRSTDALDQDHESLEE